LNHPVEAVTRVLAILETFDFKISIKQILEEEEAWMDDILTLKSVGEDWKRIRQEQEDGNLSG
jgi:hypothetical protein